MLSNTKLHIDEEGGDALFCWMDLDVERLNRSKKI